MKHLQLSPPLLLIVMGYPGAGKSFFARQFSNLYKLPYISEDRLRYESFSAPSFNREEDQAITRMTAYMLEELLTTGRSVVCDGAFLQLKERKFLMDYARKNGYRTLTVWLQTDLATSLQRATNRDKRSPDSKYAFEMDKFTFSQQKERLQRPEEREESVVISGKHAFRSQNLTVLRKIAAIYSESLATPSPIRPLVRPNRKFIQ